MKYFGQFEVLAKIGGVSYKLKLPEGSHIHAVSYESCLKEAVGNFQLSTTSVVLPSTFGNHTEEQQEVVLKRRVTKQDGKVNYGGTDQVVWLR